MTVFLVDMPNPDGKPSGFIARVEADHWMVALAAGLRRLGESTEFLRDVQVEIQKDGAVKVTEPRTGRIFRIAPLAEPQKPSPGEKKPVSIEPLAALPKVSPRVAWRPYRKDAAEATLPTVRERATAHELPKELPREVRRICWGGLNEQVLDHLLHLALQHVPAESGSAYLVEPRQRSFRLCAAWGPKARMLLALGLELDQGSGIAGFCVEQGILLSVSDAKRNPHFKASISRRLDYPVQSMLAAPILRHRRGVACIQLLNKKGGGPFTSSQSAVLSLLASTAGEALERGKP
jgi:hypothetical protein